MINFASKESKLALFNACVSEIISKLKENIEVSKIIDESYFLSLTLKQSVAYGLKTFCGKINNLFFTCKLVQRYLNNVEIVEENEIFDALELVALMLSQQIEFFENNMQEGFPLYDPLAYPLSYELLRRCLLNCKITEEESIKSFVSWTRIARSYYPSGILDVAHPERSKDEVLITDLNKKKASSNKRESFSVFEDVNFVAQVNTNQNDSLINSVLRCVSNAINLISALSKSKDFIINHVQLKLKNAPDQLQK